MKFSVEIRPIICQEVEADTWKEACDKVRETFEEQPWELEDIADSEIHDVTPPDEKTQGLFDRLKKVIELIERPMTPDSLDVENVGFKDYDYYDDDPEEEEVPKHVYADIHVYDGGGGHKIEKGVEYDVEALLKLEKKWAKEKEVRKDELERIKK
ncbi:hypothetical protein ES703_31951 [subsurface metagenome]